MIKDKIYVMAIDDSAVVRHTFTSILTEELGFDLTTAINPIIAQKKMAQQKPDVILLDLEMPEMDGMTFLRKLMKSTPIPVVICSSKSAKGSSTALEALDAGAVEIIAKPQLGTKQFLEESRTRIIDVVRAAASTKVKFRKPIEKVAPKLTADAIISLPRSIGVVGTTDKIIVVGASTGGTEALKEFVMDIPDNLPPILIVQHMPENFTNAFANRLNTYSAAHVSEAKGGEKLERGVVLVAPGNRHMLLNRTGNKYSVELREGPLVCRHRPSVDVLFRSAARYAGKNAIGVIMTGMGDDGARGMLEMKENGAKTIAQDEKTCIVYGMPKEAVKRNAVDHILPLKSIAKRVTELSSK